MSGKTLDVNQAEWESEVLASPILVLVDFWAEWCSPCKMVAPIVKQIAEEYDGRLRVVKVDADANPDLITQYSVMGIPTLMLMKDGEAVDRITGF
jgi:thioredoxin 1